MGLFSSFPKKQSYHRRIILFLIIFAFALFVPFSIISYNISKNNIISSIEFSNSVISSQMNLTYRYNSDLMANICLEVFLSGSVQQIIYNYEIDYFDISAYMLNLAGIKATVNSSIDSIVLYNSRRGEWFSTFNTDPPAGQDLMAFTAGQNYIPKLKPILRQITRNQGNITTNLWVFSYFMYQFSDPTENRDSYIVVNQNANWFIDALTMVQQAGNQAYFTFLINETGIVYRNRSGLSLEAEELLARHLFQRKKNGNLGLVYEQKINNNRYLVSSIQMGEMENYLLFVRNYNDVFRDLINLQRDYPLTVAVFLLLMSILSIPFSKRLYFPISEFLSSLTTGDKDIELSPNMENEFAYLKNLYANAGELNKRLLEQSSAYEPLVIERKLLELIYDSIEDTIEDAFLNFTEAFPNHWLSKKADKLRALIFKPDCFMGKDGHEKTDTQLLFQAIKNIIYRSFDEAFDIAFFQENTEYISAVYRSENTGEKELLEFIDNCQISARHHLNIPLSVSYSDLTDEVSALKIIYQQAKEILQYRFIFGPGSIIGKSRCLHNMENNEINYPNELDEKLISAINEKNTSRIIAVLLEIKNALLVFQYSYINICTMALLNTVIITLRKMNNEKSGADEDSFIFFFKKAKSIEFMDDFFEELKIFILSFLGNDEIQAKRRHDTHITNIMEFVQKNYNNPNLSSQMIGDNLGFTNRFLMYKFLESTGTTLTEYIINVRIRKAADLLQNTTLPVTEISRQVGIQNDNYFYRLFKKIYHCTPRLFCEIYNIQKAGSIRA